MPLPCSKLFLSVLLLISVVFPSPASVLVLYPFSADMNPSYLAPGVTASLSMSALVDKPPYIGDDGFGNVFEMYPNAGGTSPAGAVSTNSYFSLTLTALSGTLGLLNVSSEVAKGGMSDPRGFEVLTFLDGNLTSVFSQVLPTGPNAAPQPYSFALDASSASSAVLRFYGYVPDPSVNSIDYRNLQVSTAESIPEPGSWFLAGAGVLALGLWKRAVRSLVSDNT